MPAKGQKGASKGLRKPAILTLIKNILVDSPSPKIKGRRRKFSDLFDPNAKADAFEERRNDLDEEAEWMGHWLYNEHSKRLEQEIERSFSSNSYERRSDQRRRPFAPVVLESDSEQKTPSIRKGKRKIKECSNAMTDSMRKRYLKEITANRPALIPVKPAKKRTRRIILEKELIKVDEVIEKNRPKPGSGYDTDEADDDI